MIQAVGDDEDMCSASALKPQLRPLQHRNGEESDRGLRDPEHELPNSVTEPSLFGIDPPKCGQLPPQVKQSAHGCAALVRDTMARPPFTVLVERVSLS
jgi:hypothetical protein